jgi:hypothetical protein
MPSMTSVRTGAPAIDVTDLERPAPARGRRSAGTVGAGSRCLRLSGLEAAAGAVHQVTICGHTFSITRVDRFAHRGETAGCPALMRWAARYAAASGSPAPPSRFPPRAGRRAISEPRRIAERRAGQGAQARGRAAPCQRPRPRKEPQPNRPMA